MTVGAGITVADGNLMVLGKKVLSNVHDNVLVTPPSGGSLLNGAYIGVQSDQKGSRRVFPIGKLEYVLVSLQNFCFLFLFFQIQICWEKVHFSSNSNYVYDVCFHLRFFVCL
jgi:hypothetical protein